MNLKDFSDVLFPSTVLILKSLRQQLKRLTKRTYCTTDKRKGKLKSISNNEVLIYIYILKSDPPSPQTYSFMTNWKRRREMVLRVGRGYVSEKKDLY